MRSPRHPSILAALRSRAHRSLRGLAVAVGVLAVGAGPAVARPAQTLNLRQTLQAAPVVPVSGEPAAPQTARSVAASLAQTTGLQPSQVSDRAACPIAPGRPHCEAESLVTRTDGTNVHPRVRRAPTFTQVIPHRSALAAAGVALPAATPQPSAGSASFAPPSPQTPAYLQQAYDLTFLSQTRGTGDTVAIVDASDDPAAETDLAQYRAQFGLAPCTTANGCFRKVNEYGQSSPLPGPDTGWNEEESLDLDAVSALCPNCHIILVETNGYSSDMDAGIRTALSLGANQVSNSYGGASSTPYGNGSWPGASILASTGDSGYLGAGVDDYPAAWPGVTAVGGTTLSPAATATSARGFTESAWSLDSTGWGGTSGCDLQVPKPSYQADTGCTGRAYADVSADANPSTGLAVYDSGAGGWLLVGGTSLASPLTAAFEAVTGVDGSSAAWAYGAAALLNDPISGSSGACASNIAYICTAGPGYDGPTGIGSISGDIVTGAPGIGGPAVGNGSNNTYLVGAAGTTASLTGGVYPNGLDTTATWQYGTTTGYGQSTAPVDLGTGQLPALAPATLTGLAPSTTYHYRLVATNSAGTTYGYDYTFTTAGPGAVAPVNQAIPTITGTPLEGQPLTATPGTWSANPTGEAYSWQRSSDGGQTWTTIPGATGSSYTPGGADLADELQVTVTASNPYGAASATSAPTGAVASAAPVATAPPTIAGTPQRAASLTSSGAAFSGPGLSESTGWERSADGGQTWTTIAGATAASYTPGLGDEGDMLRSLVTAGNAYGTATETSAAVGPIAPNPPASTTAPAVSGIVERGDIVSATQGSWSGPDNTYAYQWQKDFGEGYVNIPGATATTYAIPTADEGAVLRVVVAASNPDGTFQQASPPTPTVTDQIPVNTAAPALTGLIQRGSTVSVSTGSWVGVGNLYGAAWQRSTDGGQTWTAIPGATATSYTLGAGDEGSRLRAVITATNPDGTASAPSPATIPVPSSPPVATSAPMVSGTPQRGATLTATSGAWAGIGNALALQWQRSGDGGQTWAAIPGATGSSYVAAIADEGDELRVLVTASNVDGSAGSASLPTAPVQSVPPVLLGAPVISGTPQRGATLTATQGTWTGTALTFAAAWQRSSDGGQTWTDIAGATGSTYTIATSDEGQQLRMRVSATDVDGTVSAASAATAVIPSSPPVLTGAPTVAGTAQRGSTLTGSPGTWGGIGTTVTTDWQRSADRGQTWSDIAGATGTTYIPGPADVGDELRLSVSASNPDGNAVSVSAPTAVVIGAPPVLTNPPSIAGQPVRGSTLSAASGTWGGIGNGYTYQWQRSADGSTWSDIAGATGSAYTLTAGEDGDVVRVKVIATNPDGSVTAASPPSSPVDSAAPWPLSAPTITGGAQRGLTVSGDPGQWAGVGNTLALQWQRSFDGRSWSAISGATGPSYTLMPADEGAIVRLQVTVANPGGTDSATSQPTPTVIASWPGILTSPVITGAPARGSLLAADPGTWSGNGTTTSLAWQRSGDGGQTWTAIPGATGSTYTPAVGDEGDTLRVEVTASNADGTMIADSSPTDAIPAAPPVQIAAPSLSGTAQRGATLTGSPGTWGGIATTVTTAWQRSTDGGRSWTALPGATGLTYTPAAADEGDELRLAVTASNVDGTLTAATPASAPVAASLPVAASAPTLSGTPQRASVLTATAGTWGGAGVSETTAWQRSTDGVTWTTIPGASGLTYPLGAGDEGTQLRLLVTASDPDGAVTLASPASGVVAAAPPIDTAAPGLGGSPVRGSSLTASTGTWSGIGNAIALQWQRSGDGGSSWTSIPGATSAIYVVDLADEGDELRVLATASNVDGSASAASPASGPVSAAPPVLTAPPVITGNPQRLAPLSASPGSFAGAGNTYAYSWQSSPDGTAWTTIPGASGLGYTPGAGDEGQRLRLLVTATNPDGSVTAASPATAPVSAAAPVDGQPPSITGQPMLGASLTAAGGSWSPADVALAYQWQRSGSSGAWQSIGGATAASYTVTAADENATLRVLVTGTNPDGTVALPSAATAPVVPPPAATSLPATPSGTLLDGSTLLAGAASWTNATSTSESWVRCPAAASAVDATCTTTTAMGPSETLTGSDVGFRIAVLITATGPGGQTSVASGLTAVVEGRALDLTSAPGISGDPQVPNTLSAVPGQWSVPLSSDTFAWLRCDAGGTSGCVTVATGASYRLAAADDGHAIVLSETATSPGHTASAQSSALTVEDQPLPEPIMPPTISGTPTRGATLTATGGSWTNSPTTLDYAWQRCDQAGGNCQPIAGATQSTYSPVHADVGWRITVAVTATNATGPATATAALTAPVTPVPPVLTATPALSNPVAQQGTLLTVSGGAWTATSDTAYADSWERCDSSGSACQTIPGATQRAYIPVAADVGHTLVAVITASNPDGAAPGATAASNPVRMSAPRWHDLPTITTANGDVGTTMTIGAATWTGPSVAADAVQLMRCMSTCVAIAGAGPGAYTITAADTGALLRVRETASNAGGATVVWSAQYVGPVASAASAAAVLSSGRAALRNLRGTELALATVTASATVSADALFAHGGSRPRPRTGHGAGARREITLRRAAGIHETLRAWACPADPPGPGASAACTRQVTFSGAAAHLVLPVTLTGQVRVVVVRRG